MDHSILNTPKPQASSTVNRRARESLPPVITSARSASDVSSPAYLSNAIDDMRHLTDKLGSLREKSEIRKLPLSNDQQIRKAASMAELYDNRRGSVAGDSEANSSLGILKLDDLQGFSESEDAAQNASDFLENFRKEYSFHTLLGKENVQPDLYPGKLSLSRLFLNERGRQVGMDTSSKVLNESSCSQSLSLQADLRLRLQKALAQRTIDRSVDSVRLSQLSDTFNIDSVSINGEVEPAIVNINKDETNPFSSNLEQTPSPGSNATFGAANFMSISGSPAVFDSSEKFQSADLAMDRMQQDENSWRQQFEDLPIMPNFDGAPKSDHAIQNLTQNLDLSGMSGIVAGEVTVSSSIMEDVGKRRLSMGEYFKYFTEHCGDAPGELPNFISSMKSPPKRKPHPPLVDVNTTHDVSVDEIPTRDSGLNKTMNYSFPDSLNFSESIKSDVTNNWSALISEEQPASKSIDLMPPPPPRARPASNMSSNHASNIRDSISTRLSMSLSLPRDADESGTKDLNSSSLSLDSGEKFVSISQMVQIMREMPAGKKSTRQFVDDFMERCRVSKGNTQSQDFESEKSSRSHHDLSNISDVKVNPKPLKEDSYSGEKSQQSPSRDERVKEWISAINNSSNDSIFNSNLEDSVRSSDQVQKATTLIPGNEPQMHKVSSYSRQRRTIHNFKASQEIDHQFPAGMKKDNYEHDESVASSFLPPPGKVGNPTFAQLRNFSTPKVHDKQMASTASKHHRAASAGQVTNKNDWFRKFADPESQYTTQHTSSSMSRSSKGSDQLSAKFHGSYDKSSDSKHSSHTSASTLKSSGQRCISHRSDSQKSDQKHRVTAESRPPSNCGSTRSAASCTESSSKHTDVVSVPSGPLQIDSTHTQLSWASVSPGSSVTQTFALRNKASFRVRILVSCPNAAFKLVGERGEISSELMLTLQSDETRRIHVVFSPISIGPIVGKLVICRAATSESSVSPAEDRWLIALYGYGGRAELAVEGASKDRWAQLFLNMTIVENDARCEISNIDASHEAPQVVSAFSLRNCGKIPVFISLQVAGELPFQDCGVYASPKEVSLMPGEVGRIVVHFDPSRDILQWLSKNADDMQLLANIWLCWSELATWQRMRRVYLKYHKGDNSGPLSTLGTLYSGDLGVGRDLKDNKSSEAALAQAVRRLKVAVLIERERLNMFDMDATMVFNELVCNETAMFDSPQLTDRTFDSEYLASPIDACPKIANNASPVSSVTEGSCRDQYEMNNQNELVVFTGITSEPQAFSLEFPPTTLQHKSKIKITFQNPSSEKSLVSFPDVSPPFSVSTSKFHVPSGSYVTISVLFRPTKSGTHHSTLNVLINGSIVRSYLLRGEGVND